MIYLLSVAIVRGPALPPGLPWGLLLIWLTFAVTVACGVAKARAGRPEEDNS